MSRQNEFLPSNHRDRNRRRVFELLLEKREMSKSDIASSLGTSVQTVTKILDHLQERGLVRCLGEGDVPKGRRPQIYGICPNAACAWTVVLEGQFIRVALVNLDGRILAMEQMEHENWFDEAVIDIICRQLQALSGQEKIIGAGIGLPGVIDQKKQQLSYAAFLDVEDPVELRPFTAQLEKRLGVDCYVENDVNAAAYGEYALDRSNAADLIFISLGTGLGAGIILNGALRTGERYRAGEIGYIRTGGESPRLEQRIGRRGLMEHWGFDPMDEICVREKDRYTKMQAVICDVLADCVAHFAIELDVSNFVLGGITIQALGEVFLEKLARRMKEICPFPIRIRMQSQEAPANAGLGKRVLNDKLDQLLGG